MTTQSGSVRNELVAGDVEFLLLVGRQQKGRKPLGLILTLLVATPNLENTNFPNTFLAILRRLDDHYVQRKINCNEANQQRKQRALKSHTFSVDKANKLHKYHTTQKYKLFFLIFHFLHICTIPDKYFKQNLQVSTMQVSFCYFLWIISRIFEYLMV